MEHYLITGGSGFLGINLTRYLLDLGKKVSTLDILPFDYEDVRERVTHYQIDIRNYAELEKCFLDGKFDIVVHAAAALPLYPRKDIFSTNIQGTENVYQAALKAEVKRVIYISSTAVYGLPKVNPIYEDQPYVGVGPYGKSKIAAEKIVQNFRLQGMCAPTIRPKSFIGPERLGVFAIFYEWAEEGRSFPMIGRGENLYQLLDVEDLCQAIYLTATHPDEKAVNTEFNIGAKVFSTMKDDYQVVLDRAGYGRKICSSPANLVVLALEILEFFKLSPLYPWVYKTATKDSFVSIEKAEKILGFTPRYSNKDALLRNYEWYLKNKEKLKKASGVSHRVPWKQGILAVAKRFF